MKKLFILMFIIFTTSFIGCDGSDSGNSYTYNPATSAADDYPFIFVNNKGASDITSIDVRVPGTTMWTNMFSFLQPKEVAIFWHITESVLSLDIKISDFYNGDTIITSVHANTGLITVIDYNNGTYSIGYMSPSSCAQTIDSLPGSPSPRSLDNKLGNLKYKKVKIK
jgi:hypothetical protein